MQRLSANVQGKCQKYNRIGPLTLVPFDKEPTFKNIKDACKSHFGTNCECFVLAGERGPSYTHESQIKDWSKVIHIRFLEYEKPQKAEEPVFVRPLHKSEPVSPRKCDSAATAVTKSSVIPRSVSLSQMLKVGQLIEPETNVVTLHLEEFAVNELKWLDPFPVTLSLHRKSFSEGSFREAYMAKPLSGLPKGDYVLKKYKEGEKPGIIELFGSMEAHTRKSVQLNALARNFAQSMDAEAPVLEFGRTFTYNKVFFSSMGNEFVTIETFIDGHFGKLINNDGLICSEEASELSMKAETFSHRYTCKKSNTQLMVLDIQKVGYTLCDPEIASTTHMDEANNYYFCTGNWSTKAIDTFFNTHKCNKYCKLLNL